MRKLLPVVLLRILLYVALVIPVLSGKGFSQEKDCSFDPNELSAFIKNVASIYKTPGPIPELPKARGVILVSAYAPSEEEKKQISDFHEVILKNLPKNSRAVVVTKSPEFYLEQFPDLIAEKRLWLYEYENDGFWARDFFPETIINGKGEMEWVQFKYYISRRKDCELGKCLAERLNIPFTQSILSLEGGNLAVDEGGRLFVSEKVFKENSKPYNLTRENVEAALKNLLKLNSVHWLKTFPGDELAHVDMYMKVLGDNKVIVADSNLFHRKSVLDDMAKTIKDLGIQVIRIKNADFFQDPDNYICTFTNCLILDKTVFLPFYHSLKESGTVNMVRGDAFKKAKSVYEGLGFNVVGVPCKDWIEMEGAVHCLTKHIP